MAAYPYGTSRWKALRMSKLMDDPLCEPCLSYGRVEPAEQVDHIKAINAGGEAFPDLDGLMSMCASCHSFKTNVRDRPDRTASFKRALRGFDLDGNPIDPEGW